LLVAWIYVFHDSFISAAEIWYISEIFNHCFFILPGAIFLIYRQRYALQKTNIKPNYWLALPLIGLLVLYALGLAGDVQLFMHVATFSSLPLIIWLLIGNQAAKVILFPLLFMLFAIPVGEELIPFFQQITADISIPLLSMTGVPTFRSGLYVEIPNGKFLIAEACSGISFFIASVVIGTLYAHLNIKSFWKKCCFILLAILYPILANALRVYGIILTAYLTDMEYAAGADHLIYGGVFFAIVIISLLFIGELFRDKMDQVEDKTALPAKALISDKYLKPTIVLCLIILLSHLWFVSISQRINYVENNGTSLELNWMSAQQESQPESSSWQPNFANAELQSSGSFTASSGARLDYFMAYYVLGKGELVSSLNRLYSQDNWTIVNYDTWQLGSADSPKPVYMERITNSNGSARLLASWYVVDGKSYSDKRWAKLSQIFNIMLANPANGAVIAISMPISNENAAEQQAKFKSDLADVYTQMVDSLPSSTKQP